MGLRDIEYQEDYRSGYDNILDDFLCPSLRESKLYWRAVGYFSSSALESFGLPLGEFVSKGGTIRLVTSVRLSAADIIAIEKGTSKRDVYVGRINEIVEEQFSNGIGHGVILLTNLLALGRLEIQIAVPKTGIGIYHEKIGLFFDDGDFVAFTGSLNESRNAFENNRECIDVFTKWESPSRAQRKLEHFEALWNRTDKGVDVYDFPEAARRKLIQIYEECQAGEHFHKKTLKLKWHHQDIAVQKFLAEERGILNMATGTGKTRTALMIIKALHERGNIDTVIVCTDGNDLLDQWYADLLSIRKAVKFNVYRHYKTSKEIQEFLLYPQNAILLVSREPVALVLKQLKPKITHRTIIIYDEVHGLGSPANRSRLTGLSDNIRFRLGLSATPEREYDEEGNVFLEKHIGKEIMRFELDDAIRRGILSPFNYYPISYELTTEDRERLRDVYRKQAARAAAGNPMSEEDVWIDIARVYKTASAKIPLFNEFLKQNADLLKRCIVFVETQDYGERVLEVIHKYRHDFHTYYSGEYSDTLKRFARGELECLITCHRVSEGIDIKSLNSVVLFSSSRARLETIQRIGRCLRVDPENPGKIANIVDFIRRSDDGGSEYNSDEERAEWLMRLSEIRAGEVDDGTR